MASAAQIGLGKVRVMGVFAHVDAGKTTLSEAILFYCGRIHRVGRVDDGSTQLDWMAQERERGITISAASTSCLWNGRRINLIDTPGHVDFSAEVMRSIRVIDGAVMVLCGVGGVEPQTESVWLHADDAKLPRIVFVNKLDRTGADFDRVVGSMRSRLAQHAVALQLPVGREESFRGVIDVLSRRTLIWLPGSEDPEVQPVPPEDEDTVEAARNELVDRICETDIGLLERRIAGEEPDVDDLGKALRRAVIRGKLVPVLCGSAVKRIGVQPLLDAVAAYFPAPYQGPVFTRLTRRRRRQAHIGLDGPLCAAAFKIVTDPHVGRLTWVRIFTGRIREGDAVFNPRTDSCERVSRMYHIHAERRVQADEIGPGDVAALVGVKSAVTGDTLCDPEHPIELHSSRFPEPVIMVALRPGTDGELQRLCDAVQRLCEEDPTLLSRFDAETREQTLAGMGELHLEVAVDRLRREFGLNPQTSQPQVAYRETVRGPAELVVSYRQQSGGHGHYAEIHLRMEPASRGEGVTFEEVKSRADRAAHGGHGRHGWVPAEFVRPVERGLRATLEQGVMAGYPVTDVKVSLLGGRSHRIDSCERDFQVVGAAAAWEVFRAASPALLEPVMRIALNVSEEHVGSVAADLGRRRGRVLAMDAVANRHRITGEVPLADARGYATDLRTLTSGQGTFILEFHHYAAVPDAMAAAIIEQRRADRAIPVWQPWELRNWVSVVPV